MAHYRSTGYGATSTGASHGPQSSGGSQSGSSGSVSVASTAASTSPMHQQQQLSQTQLAEAAGRTNVSAVKLTSMQQSQQAAKAKLAEMESKNLYTSGSSKVATQPTPVTKPSSDVFGYAGSSAVSRSVVQPTTPKITTPVDGKKSLSNARYPTVNTFGDKTVILGREVTTSVPGYAALTQSAKEGGPVKSSYGSKGIGFRALPPESSGEAYKKSVIVNLPGHSATDVPMEKYVPDYVAGAKSVFEKASEARARERMATEMNEAAKRISTGTYEVRLPSGETMTMITGGYDINQLQRLEGGKEAVKQLEEQYHPKPKEPMEKAIIVDTEGFRRQAAREGFELQFNNQGNIIGGTQTTLQKSGTPMKQSFYVGGGGLQAEDFVKYTGVGQSYYPTVKGIPQKVSMGLGGKPIEAFVYETPEVVNKPNPEVMKMGVGLSGFNIEDTLSFKLPKGYVITQTPVVFKSGSIMLKEKTPDISWPKYARDLFPSREGKEFYAVTEVLSKFTGGAGIEEQYQMRKSIQEQKALDIQRGMSAGEAESKAALSLRSYEDAFSITPSGKYSNKSYGISDFVGEVRNAEVPYFDIELGVKQRNVLAGGTAGLFTLVSGGAFIPAALSLAAFNLESEAVTKVTGEPLLGFIAGGATSSFVMKPFTVKPVQAQKPVEVQIKTEENMFGRQGASKFNQQLNVEEAPIFAGGKKIGTAKFIGNVNADLSYDTRLMATVVPKVKLGLMDRVKIAAGKPAPKPPEPITRLYSQSGRMAEGYADISRQVTPLSKVSRAGEAGSLSHYYWKEAVPEKAGVGAAAGSELLSHPIMKVQSLKLASVGQEGIVKGQPKATGVGSEIPTTTVSENIAGKTIPKNIRGQFRAEGPPQGYYSEAVRTVVESKPQFAGRTINVEGYKGAYRMNPKMTKGGWGYYEIDRPGGYKGVDVGKPITEYSKNFYYTGSSKTFKTPASHLNGVGDVRSELISTERGDIKRFEGDYGSKALPKELVGTSNEAYRIKSTFFDVEESKVDNGFKGEMILEKKMPNKMMKPISYGKTESNEVRPTTSFKFEEGRMEGIGGNIQQTIQDLKRQYPSMVEEFDTEMYGAVSSSALSEAKVIAESSLSRQLSQPRLANTFKMPLLKPMSLRTRQETQPKVIVESTKAIAEPRYQTVDVIQQPKINNISRIRQEARTLQQPKLSQEFKVSQQPKVMQEMRVAQQPKIIQETRVAQQARQIQDLRFMPENRMVNTPRIYEPQAPIIRTPPPLLPVLGGGGNFDMGGSDQDMKKRFYAKRFGRKNDLGYLFGKKAETGTVDVMGNFRGRRGRKFG